MVLNWISWYFTIEILGLTVFPIAIFLFPKLEDKGYFFSKAIGLFLWGYFYWLLTSLGLLRNSLSGILIVFIIIFIISVYLLVKDRAETLKHFFRRKISTILTAEILFLLFFCGMAFMRAAMPNIDGTEKPMELAFINSILNSSVFPPSDPWLSGYSISYYYFGYVIVSILIRITGVSSGIGFNLAVALWFALTAISSYGILYNLLARYQKSNQKSPNPVIGALLAPVFILITSNLEGFLEVLHARGFFWKQLPDGQLVSRFWNWLNILELNSAPVQPFSWIPNRPNGIVWWRASRVISDFNLSGNRFEVIDEFPFFSYYLADLHPHVIAMPFVLLVIGFAFQTFIKFSEDGIPPLTTWVKRADFWIISLFVGGLGFLNIWDFPIYVGLFALIYTSFIFLKSGWSKRIPFVLLFSSLLLGCSGFILYFPFYIGFSSQAGGFLPGLNFFTRGVLFWIFFAPLLLPVFIWTGSRLKKTDLSTWFSSLKYSFLIVSVFWGFSYLIGLIIIVIPKIIQSQNNQILEKILLAYNQFLGLHGSIDGNQLLIDSFKNRLLNPGTWITLLFLISLVMVIIGKSRDADVDHKLPLNVRVDGFIGILIFLGCGLTLFPEFFYLRDQFATRMNTIFKFYFQAWIIWGIAASYAVTMLLQLRTVLFKILSILIIPVLLMSLTYPAFLISSTIRSSSFGKLTLDGNQFHDIYSHLDYEAALWLQNRPDGTIAEAIGGSYSSFGQMAMISGKPTVLGWIGHELQWRGGTKEIGSRESDIKELYETNNWVISEKILKEYSIRYIIIGSKEYQIYQVDDQKFRQHLPIIFENQDITIFEFLPN